MWGGLVWALWGGLVWALWGGLVWGGLVWALWDGSKTPQKTTNPSHFPSHLEVTDDGDDELEEDIEAVLGANVGRRLAQPHTRHSSPLLQHLLSATAVVASQRTLQVVNELLLSRKKDFFGGLWVVFGGYLMVFWGNFFWLFEDF